MASEQYHALMAARPGGNVDHTDPIEVVREKMHAIHPNAASPGTIVEPVDLGGIEAKWIFLPEHRESPRVVLHVHGGAFVSTVIDHYLMTIDEMHHAIDREFRKAGIEIEPSEGTSALYQPSMMMA